MAAERFELAADRIRQIPEEESVRLPFRNYFREVSEFILLLLRLKEEVDSGRYARLTEGELDLWNRRLYEDILPGNYKESFADPETAVKLLGKEEGQILSFLYSELRSGIPFVVDKKEEYLTVQMELFLEIYNFYENEVEDEDKEKQIRELKEILFWYASDYCEVFAADGILDRIDPSRSTIIKMIKSLDLTDPAYIYQFGEYVGETEAETARHLAFLGEEEICEMAEEHMRDLQDLLPGESEDDGGVKTVNLVYQLGYERVVRQVVRNLEQLGVKAVCCRASEEILLKNRQWPKELIGGFCGSGPNPQYTQDHLDDAGLFLGKRYVDRRLEVISYTCAKNREAAGRYAGTMVLGKPAGESIIPAASEEAVRLSVRQEELLALLAERTGQIIKES